ncbi:hypothetical protein DNI29_07105 [Hymenobacter sediminis]|uniref:hypothetical protein n=1 Tax=Hymenobacter sediminis TaxID=2218621 RepID=UPI000F4D5039|nr:hypothetical protein [Hymenobacter sediminis]RPD48387.1 hypothetical protein DNI29_07105 [Hymenobacter sediminis]
MQFLVIAFLWYEQPEPLLGMYYQQLLFWAFVLVTGVGGGRYSIDYQIWKRTARGRNTQAAQSDQEFAELLAR